MTDHLREFAMAKGVEGLREAATARLITKICKPGNKWDGQQTSIKNADLIEHAQHATATCCRRCIEYWHGIKRESDVNPEELTYLTDLMMQYLLRRLPDLPQRPVPQQGND